MACMKFSLVAMRVTNGIVSGQEGFIRDKLIAAMLVNASCVASVKQSSSFMRYMGQYMTPQARSMQFSAAAGRQSCSHTMTR